MFHYYMGGPGTIFELSGNRADRVIQLGEDVAEGEMVYHLIPAGTWFGAFFEPNIRIVLWGAQFLWLSCGTG
jgi:predicted cupin superfamily sugar epimerase